MPFFARPDFSNEQFKQLPGSEISLSGQTQIATWTGLTLSDGSGGNVIITASGSSSGTTGYILGQDVDGIIKLLPSPASGTSKYYGASPTTCSVGGIPAGTSISGCTFQSIIQSLLVPALPLSTSICVATGFIGGSVSPSSRQFGDCSVGNLCWCVNKQTNPICSIYLSTTGGTGYNCVKLNSGCLNVSTGGTVGYTYTLSCATPSSAITSTSVPFSVCAKSTDGCTSVSNTSITWMNKKFSFGNTTLYTNSAISSVLSATTGTLSTSKALNVSCTLSNQFFYYAYPKVLGTPSFTINGLPNNAWGNPSTGTLFTITFKNTNGYSNQYYVTRSDSRITGTYCIIAS